MKIGHFNNPGHYNALFVRRYDDAPVLLNPQRIINDELKQLGVTNSVMLEGIIQRTGELKVIHHIPSARELYFEKGEVITTSWSKDSIQTIAPVSAAVRGLVTIDTQSTGIPQFNFREDKESTVLLLTTKRGGAYLIDPRYLVRSFGSGDVETWPTDNESLLKYFEHYNEGKRTKFLRFDRKVTPLDRVIYANVKSIRPIDAYVQGAVVELIPEKKKVLLATEAIH